MSSPRAFTRVGGERVFRGHVISLHVDRFRYDADEQWNPVDVFLDKPIKPARLMDEIRKIGAAKTR